MYFRPPRHRAAAMTELVRITDVRPLEGHAAASCAARCQTLRVSGRLRLADLLGGLSIAADLGFGLPPEEAMRSCLLGTAHAREQGLPEDVVADCFYTA